MTFAEKIPSDEGIDSVSEPNRTFAEQSFPSAAPMALMPNATLAAKYCFDRGIAFGDFTDVVFKSSLYPHARQLVNFLGLIPGYFDADLEFVTQVGRLTTIKQLEALILDFTDHRHSQGLLRSSLNLRISARKVRQIASPYLLREGEFKELPNRQTPSSSPSVPANRDTELHNRPGFRTRSRDDQESTEVSAPRSSPAKASRKKLDTQTEIALLQEEVARLIDQRDILKKAMGIICESPQKNHREPT